MPTRDQKLVYLAGGVAFAVLGAFLVWKGFMTAPGEPAIQVPRQEDWSATEAKVIGLAFFILGVYVAAFLGRRS